ncbi:MAG: hypothetical protein GY801_06885 [bacterium]|nr:hypothetical protein [bacterium]
MDIISFTYTFTFPDGEKEEFFLEIDHENFELTGNIPDNLPAWTKLTYHQCPHCPLDVSTHPYCPLAANQVTIVKRLSSFLPYQKVSLSVTAGERTILQETTIQAAVGSLMGLIMPTSGCPYTAYFKPMARFHLPLAGSAETIYRSVSMYIMAQFFLHEQNQQLLQDGMEDVDFAMSGLARIYENIHTVNTALAERFLAASKKDSSVDAIVQLDIYAMTFLGILDEPLEELRPLFNAYFAESN